MRVDELEQALLHQILLLLLGHPGEGSRAGARTRMGHGTNESILCFCYCTKIVCRNEKRSECEYHRDFLKSLLQKQFAENAYRELSLN